MENINFQILKSQSLINTALQDLPVGIGYYLLKTKLENLEKLYYQQAQKEYQQMQKQVGQQEEQQGESD